MDRNSKWLNVPKGPKDKRYDRFEGNIDKAVDAIDEMADDLESLAKDAYRDGRVRAFKRFDRAWRQVTKLQSDINDEINNIIKLLPDDDERKSIPIPKDAGMDTNKIASELVRIARDLAAIVKPGDLQVGDIVRHTRKFLKSTAWYTDVPRSGEVVEVAERGFMSGWPVVQWDDGEEAAINPANVELIRKGRRNAADDDDDWDLDKLEIKAKKFRQDLEDNGWRESGIAFYSNSKYPDIFIDANALTSTVYAMEEWDSYSHMVQTYDELKKELSSKHYKVFVRRFNNTKKLRKSNKWKPYRGKGVNSQDEVFSNREYPGLVAKVSYLDGKFKIYDLPNGVFTMYKGDVLGEVNDIRKLDSAARSIANKRDR